MLENLSRLEERIKAAVDTIGLQQLELDEAREENTRLSAENTRLQTEIGQWNQQIQSLLVRFDEVDSEPNALAIDAESKG